MLSRLPVQPLERIHAMQLIQAGMAQQISGEVVAIAELRVLIHLGIELLQLLLHGCGCGGIRLKVHLQNGGGEQPVQRHGTDQGTRSSKSWSRLWRLHQATTVFTRSIVTVIGPTPPGTGDSAAAIDSTSAA